MADKKQERSFSMVVEDHIRRYFSRLEGDVSGSQIYDDVVDVVERILIKEALRHCNNVQIKAAKVLGINRNTLHKKIKKLEIAT